LPRIREGWRRLHDGEGWRRLRGICALELLSARRVRSFQAVRENEVGHLLGAIAAASTRRQGIGGSVARGSVSREGEDQRPLDTTMDGSFRALVANLLALPVPTVAAVTGHAAVALAHVAVVMRGSRGRSAPAWQERPLEQRIG
jgi:hypothetical protein